MFQEATNTKADFASACTYDICTPCKDLNYYTPMCLLCRPHYISREETLWSCSAFAAGFTQRLLTQKSPISRGRKERYSSDRTEWQPGVCTYGKITGTTVAVIHVPLISRLDQGLLSVLPRSRIYLQISIAPHKPATNSRVYTNLTVPARHTLKDTISWAYEFCKENTSFISEFMVGYRTWQSRGQKV